MKRLIQFILYLTIIAIIFYLYKNFFQNDNIPKIDLKDESNSLINESKNNVIKNLKYEIKPQPNTQYTITSELSEIINENGVEIVEMKRVIALFIEEEGVPLIITSDEAIFNNSTYNTNFKKNVKVEYLDNIIYSEKLDLDFTKNIVTIYDNVIYQGLKGEMITDNIKINIITKKIEIFMDNKNAKVKVISK